MGFMKTLVKTIEYAAASDEDKAKKWMEDHPALTVEEELCRNRYLYGSFYKNESMSYFVVDRDNATGRFIDECKLLNETFPYLSEEKLKIEKLNRYMELKDCIDSSFGYIKYDLVLRIVDDTRPSRMKAEAVERERIHFTIDKAKKYCSDLFDREIANGKKKK